MPVPSPSSALASPSLGDFDALLAAPPPSPGDAQRPVTSSPSALAVTAGAPAPSGEPVATAGSVQEPPDSSRLRQFADNWTLYRDPVLAGTFAGLVLGLAGVFIVLRRAVFVTAAVSQAAALGVATAFLLGIHLGVEPPPVLLAFAFGAAGALALALGHPSRLPREAIVGIVYLASGSLAIVVGDRISQEAHDVSALLFGSAVLVQPVDLWLVLGVGTGVAATLLAVARSLEFSGFDPEAARVQGIPVRRLEVLLWLLVAAEVAVTTRALGALPVFAFAVLPAFGALRLTRRFPACLALAAVFGAASGSLGYVAAFVFDLPVGASQTAVTTLIAVVATLAGRRR